MSSLRCMFWFLVMVVMTTIAISINDMTPGDLSAVGMDHKAATIWWGHLTSIVLAVGSFPVWVWSMINLK